MIRRQAMAETAREFFEGVADAARRHRQTELILTFGPPRRGGARAGVSDPVSARAVSDESAREIMAATEETIGDGLRRIAELRRIFARMADAIDLYYIDYPLKGKSQKWADVAYDIGVSEATAKRWCGELFGFIDQVGWARLRNYGDGA